MENLRCKAVVTRNLINFAADPVSALLVVQNHSAVKDAAVLTSIGDQFASALGSHSGACRLIWTCCAQMNSTGMIDES